MVETAGRIATSHTDRLHVRIGIASGLVVVAGLGASGEPLAFGEAATSAAGLVSRAEANTVLISGGMRRLVGDLFHYRDHAPIMLDVPPNHCGPGPLRAASNHSMPHASRNSSAARRSLGC